MNRIGNLILAIALAILIIGCNNNQKSGDQEVSDLASGPRNVELKKNEKGYYRLFVDDEEFYIWGAGLEFGDKKLLASHGANSFRNWSTDNGRETGQEVLDEALENGLMVFMGLDIKRERHGFDYDDETQVQQQKEEIREQIMAYKDHPALLGWGVGNELNLHYTNKKVWDAVNDIAKMIHEIDGNHPATTMLAGINKEEVDYLEANCPDLDFISIQMYGDIINLQQRIAEAGYDGPYMISEWGATGHWEVGSTEWGAPIEQTSSEKATGIKERFEKAMLSDSARCIGTYVFLWGQKQERTPTWYGLFTENNEEMESIDVMHYFWNDNQWPSNGTPRIIDASISGKRAVDNIHVSAGDELAFTYEAKDLEGDDLTLRFEVMKEATDLQDGGDLEERPEAIEGLFVSQEQGKVLFKSPAEKGPYRAFLYVLDGNGHAGTVNIPFYVD